MSPDDLQERDPGDLIDHFRSVVAASADAIFTQDRVGRITSWNGAAERLSGWAEHEVVGRTHSVLAPEGRLPEQSGWVSRALSGERVERLPWELRRRDGSVVPVLVTAMPWRLAGKLMGISVIARDVSDQQQLREADRMKDEFLSIVSHELRTPLASIIGMTYALSNERQPPEPELQKDLLQRITRNADEMRRMIERLLDFSRLQAGRVDLNLVPLDLDDAVARCLGNLAGVLDEKAVVVDVPARLVVQADEDGFNRVLQNLLTNAAKFSPPDGVVTVKAMKQGDHACISVRDEGRGIPQERQEHIFDRFVQLPDQPVGTRGTGVGLAIVARYVELQGGRIWVDSELGAGATFSFTLPLAPA